MFVVRLLLLAVAAAAVALDLVKRDTKAVLAELKTVQDRHKALNVAVDKYQGGTGVSTFAMVGAQRSLESAMKAATTTFQREPDKIPESEGQDVCKAMRDTLGL